MLRKIECIFFDLDGLLLDTEKLYTRFWMEAAQACGHNMTKETALQLRSCDSTVARSIIQRDLGEQADYAQIRSERKKRMNQYLETHPMELKTGALEILSCLDAFPHVKKVVVTSSHAGEKDRVLEQLGIKQHLTDIVYAESVKRGKPYPDIYTYACNKVGVLPQNCIALEDSPNGICSAYEADITVLMIPDLSEPDETLRNKCTALSSLQEAADYLMSQIEVQK